MTAIIDESIAAWGVMLHPNKAQSWSIGGALGFYYKAAIIPFILFVLVYGTFFGLLGAFLGFLLGHILGSSGLSSLGAGAGYLIVALLGVLGYFIFIPISLLILAALMQGVGGALKMLKGGGYNVTLSALINGEMPTLMLSWIPFIAFIGGIWSVIVTILSLAKLQKMSVGAAFGLWLLTGIVGAIILFIVSAIIG